MFSRQIISIDERFNSWLVRDEPEYTTPRAPKWVKTFVVLIIFIAHAFALLAPRPARAAAPQPEHPQWATLTRAAILPDHQRYGAQGRWGSLPWEQDHPTGAQPTQSPRADFLSGRPALDAESPQNTEPYIDFDIETGVLTVTMAADNPVLEMNCTLNKVQFNDFDPIALDCFVIARIQVFGRDGDDFISMQNVSNAFFSDLVDGGITLFGRDGDDQLIGSPQRDILIGGNGNDDINGGDGSDAMYGEAGNDSLIGGEGDDQIEGGVGNEFMAGDQGNDTLSGGGGTDVIDGGNGENWLLGNGITGNVTLNNSSIIINGQISGIDGISHAFLVGSDGNEWIDASAFTTGNVILDGRDGNDTLLGSELGDTLLGGEDNDSLMGGEGNDSLEGGGGFDTLLGGGGDDWVYGQANNDFLGGGDGTNLLDGGVDTDTLYEILDYDMHLFTDTLITYVPISPTLTIPLTQTLINIEAADLSGGNSANLLDATGYPYTLTLRGGGGNDVLLPGDHAVAVYGGDGDDSLPGTQFDDTLVAGEGNDTLWGYEGDDWIELTNGTNWVYPMTGNDTVIGGGGNDEINGDEGDDYITGDAGNDTLYGSVGNDQLYGNSGSDLLLGEAGNDTLASGEGQDSLYGGEGNDFLITDDAGQKSLYGGQNDDVYVAQFGVAAQTLVYENAEQSADIVRVEGLPDPLLGDQIFFTATQVTNALSDTLTYEGAAIEALQINLNEGDDKIEIVPSETLSLTVDGGEGNDTLIYDFTDLDNVVDDEANGKITADGRAPVWYAHFELRRLIQNLYDIFLPLVRR